MSYNSYKFLKHKESGEKAGDYLAIIMNVLLSLIFVVNGVVIWRVLYYQRLEYQSTQEWREEKHKEVQKKVEEAFNRNKPEIEGNEEEKKLNDDNNADKIKADIENEPQQKIEEPKAIDTAKP